MSKPNHSPPKNICVERIVKPVITEDWATDMYEHGIYHLKDSAEMFNPDSYGVSLISAFEINKVSSISVQAAEIIRQGLQELRTHIFYEEPTLPTEKVIIKRPRRILVGIARDEVLVRERRAVLALLKIATGLNFPDRDDFHFNVEAGSVLDTQKSVPIIHGLTDNGLPTSVRLGQAETTMIDLSTGQPFGASPAA